MQKFREKIIDALLENAKLALFEFCGHNAEKAAEKDMGASENGAKICFASERYGDGTRQPYWKRFIGRYARHINKITGAVDGCE